MVTRRDAIKTLGGLAGAAGLARLLPGCGSNGKNGITNYVFMMLENRTYDHYFGARSLVEGLPGDGLTAAMMNPDTNGVPVAPYVPAMSTDECVKDPDHSWDGSRLQWNNGANDGFVKQQEAAYGIGSHEPMQYYTRDLLPVSWALADAYTTCDRWFASVLGPTWPNRFYWMCGTSGGLMDNELPGSNGTVNFPTIFNSLHDANIDWAYYDGSLPVVSALDSPGQYQIDVSANVKNFTHFMTDAMAGKLPTITYIDPAFYQNDDHPPIHPINGQALISTVYTALANSPQWKNTLLVVTYDEHGGFFDHVSPGMTTDDMPAFMQRGFRVPAMVIGPYVKQGYVSSVELEHTSALHHIEETFDLPPLNSRTAAQNDLSDCIDMDRLAKGDWAPPIELPDIDPDSWQMGPACTYTGSARVEPEHVDPITAWANKYPERIAGLDLRPQLPQYEKAIKDFMRANRGKVPVR